VLLNGAEKFIECIFFSQTLPSTGRWLLVLCEKLLPAIVALENREGYAMDSSQGYIFLHTPYEEFPGRKTLKIV
jgi:hypothetical protein